MISQYRVQLNLISLVKLMALIGFGIGLVVGIATIFWSFRGGIGLGQALLSALISPFSNALIMAVFAVIGYPFYGWYCNRNRGQVLRGRFLEEKRPHQD